MNQSSYVDVVLRTTHSLMVDSFVKQCEEKYDESTLKLKQMVDSLVPLLDLADKQQPLTRTTLVDKRVTYLRNFMLKREREVLREKEIIPDQQLQAFLNDMNIGLDWLNFYKKQPSYGLVSSVPAMLSNFNKLK